MIDILMYMLKNHMEKEYRFKERPQKIMTELERVGFNKQSIKKAFNWLAELNILQFTVKTHPPHQDSVRIFSIDEMQKINKESRGFIVYLQRIGIINSAIRELVISQLMQLDDKKVTLDQVQWVILMILYNQPDKHNELLGLIHLIINNSGTIH